MDQTEDFIMDESEIERAVFLIVHEFDTTEQKGVSLDVEDKALRIRQIADALLSEKSKNALILEALPYRVMLRREDYQVVHEIVGLQLQQAEHEHPQSSPESGPLSRILLEGARVHYLTLPLFFVGTPADVRLDLPASKDSE